MKITVKDIAKKAGVAPSTVSRAFNNENIAEDTKRKVLEIAKKYNFKPRSYDIKKMENKIKNIAILHPFPFTSGDYYNNVVNGIQENINFYNFNTHFILLTDNEEENIKKIETNINNQNIEGLIFTSVLVEKKLINIIKKKFQIPVVAIDNDVIDEKIDCIVNDDFNGALKVVNHLIELGHKNIVFFGRTKNLYCFRERYRGYVNSLRSAGLEIDKDLINFFHSRDKIYEEQLFKEVYKYFSNINKNFSAVFATSDKTAITIISALKDLGYSIPEDISVCGFDDIDIAKYMDPSLTTVKIYKKKLGVMAVQRLNNLICNIKKSLPVKMTLPVDLKIRKSTVDKF